MKSLLQYLKDYRKEAVLAPLLKLLEASFDLIVPLVMAEIIDTGIAEENRPYIFAMCGVLLLLAAVGLAVSITAQWFAAKAATGASHQLRLALFSHIQDLSCTQIDRIGTDTLITRMTSDMNQVQSGINLTLRLLLRSPFIVLGAMILAFTVDVQAALVFAVVIPVLCVVVFGIMLGTLPMYRRVQGRLDGVMTATRENLTGARVIRAFGREEHEIASFRDNNDTLTHLQQSVGRISGLMNPLTYVIVNLATAALIQVGAVRVDIGSLTQGQVVALLNYMSQILVELVKLANLIIQISRALACAGRIQDILAMEPDMEDVKHVSDAEASDTCSEISADALTPRPENSPSRNSPNGVSDAEASDTCSEISADALTPRPENSPSRNSPNGVSDACPEPGAGARKEPPLVEFRHVSLTYAGAAGRALEDLSFTVRRGETVGIIGGTGSGKSSLVNLIPRFYDATEGEVLVFGRDVREYRQEELRAQIGVVPQKAELFRGSIAENLAWGLPPESCVGSALPPSAAASADSLPLKDAPSGRPDSAENGSPAAFAPRLPSEEEMQAALAASQAKEFVDQKEGGTAFLLEQNGRNLSGGQRQRLTIARALIRHPQILILDDSASALDFATDAKLRAAIRALDPQPTAFIVSQRAASVQYADQILVLDEGRLAGHGTHEELLRSSAVYQEIYYSQFPKEEVSG